MRVVWTVLADPVSAMRRALAHPEPARVGLLLLLVVVLLGMATVPRQFALLAVQLPALPSGSQGPEAVLRDGIERLIVLKRLLPSPTLLFAAVALALVAEPGLALAATSRRAIWTVVWLGIVPLVVDRVGELAVTYLVADSVRTTGDVIKLPDRFLTGPMLFWRGEGSPPGWLVMLESRLSLITLWSVGLWAVGLRELDGAKRLEAWHVLLPLGCLILAGALTWMLTPLAVAVALRVG